MNIYISKNNRSESDFVPDSENDLYDSHYEAGIAILANSLEEAQQIAIKNGFEEDDERLQDFTEVSLMKPGVILYCSGF